MLRSHIGRPMDFTRRSNQLVGALLAVTLATALVIWVSNGTLEVLWAPLHLFVFWALTRELDPDHESTAILAGVSAAVWVLIGLDTLSVIPVAALLLASRLVTNTTGRRPLVTDYLVVAVVATAVSYTELGWVAGFGLAVAIYVDDRMTGQPTRAGVITAAVAAIGASVLATAASAFPRALPDIRPGVVLAVGLLALMTVVREPVPPRSVSDSRLKTPISQDRLHVSRAMVGLLAFGSTLLAGVSADRMVPVMATLAIVLAGSEVERIAGRR